MASANKTQAYLGSYIFGILLLLVIAVRTFILYTGHKNLVPALAAMAVIALLYLLEPVLSPRFRWPWHLYFALQTGLIVALSSLRPYLDVNGTLYILISVQAMRSLSRRAAFTWNILFIVLLTLTMILGSGLVIGVVISMLITAIGMFMVTYDVLYVQAQTEQAESQVLLAKLQDAHQQLQEFASQAEELVAASERNRLSRELHDSVGQTIFSATLTARSAQLLLDKDPTQVSEQLERLQEMTSAVLSQLRSLITQMRPEG